MLKDKSKMAINIGHPSDIDLEKNVVIPGDIYEDPVFVNDNGQEVSTNEAVAESRVDHGVEHESNNEVD